MRQRGGSEQPVKGRRATRPKARNLMTAAPSIADLQKQVGALTLELQEAREQQTATANVLKVISRSAFDLQAVLQTLVESAARLCDADMAQITRQRDGVFFRAEAYGFPDQFIEYSRTIPVAADRGSAIGRALLEGTAIHIPDALADPEYTFTEGQRLADFRAVLADPMLREGAPIGVIVMTRKEARPFTQKQIELATTFADQAVIAIENVRLFTETRETLERQTATAEVLQVINSSPGDLAPVFDAILEKAMRPCQAQIAVFWTYDGEFMRASAIRGAPQAYVEFLQRGPHRPTHVQLRLLEGNEGFVQIADLTRSEGYRIGDPLPRAAADLGGIRTLLVVPLRKIWDRAWDIRGWSEGQGPRTSRGTSATGQKLPSRPRNPTSALPPKDGIIGRPSLWIAEDFGCCASG